MTLGRIVPHTRSNSASLEVSRPRRRLRGLVAVALAVSCASITLGQQNSVTLSGSVNDPSGARIPWASVVIINPDQSVTEATTAGADGSFRIEGLAPSPLCEVEIVGPIGFLPHRQSVNLTADHHIDIELEVDLIVEAIVVSGTRQAGDPALSKSPRRRIRVGGNLKRARLVHHVPALYPADAEREGIEGTVLLEAAISRDGTLTGLAPVNSIVDERLVTAATEAVLQWRYEPARLNGQPFEIGAKISVAFELP